jgi:hypothetical protein
MALFEIPVSGWTCFNTTKVRPSQRHHHRHRRANTNLCRCRSCKSPYESFVASSSRHQPAPCSSLRSSWQLWWLWMPQTWQVPWKRSMRGLFQRSMRAIKVIICQHMFILAIQVDYAYFGCHCLFGMSVTEDAVDKS